MKKILEADGAGIEGLHLQPAAMKKNSQKWFLSNRPDLCEYQCNGAMAAAKAYRKKKPIDIANAVVETADRRTKEAACILQRQWL